MKSRPPVRIAYLVATASCLLLFATARAETTQDTWTRVQSQNFQLVGNAGERDILKVAARLEQFRQAFSRLLSVEHFDSSVPLTFMVFKTDDSYRPFEPLYQGQPAGVAGFFQSSPDVDYITLSVDRKHARDTAALAFHEYVHLLVRNSFPNAPLWFNEGLAEYYSTFEVAGDNKRVRLGKPSNYRLQTLREREILPFEILFRVDTSSAYYNEKDKRQLYYAQAWALVHQLLSGPRRAQLPAFLGLLGKGVDLGTAFEQAFQATFAQMENELRVYIQRNKYPEQFITFEKGLEHDALMQSSVITAAETQFYLGDLLLHTHRLEAAEPYLKRSIELDSNLAQGHASLGMLRMRQNRFEEARKHLERAAAQSSSYLVHYYYAYVLSQDAPAHDNVAGGYYSPEKAKLIRAELKRVIELAPNFAEAYRLLAFVNFISDDYLEESISLLKTAITLSPRRQQLPLLLAQVYLRLEAFDAARTTLDTLGRGGLNPQVEEQARTLLERIAAREALVARVKAMNEDALKEETPTGIVQPCDAPQPGPQLKKLRFEGEQICGLLVQVECEGEGVVLVVESNGKTVKLHSDRLNRIRFVTYTSEVRGQMTCGLRLPANPVLVTYRANAGQPTVNGEVIAVEFVPREWNANH